jgi:hypothetical protein
MELGNIEIIISVLSTLAAVMGIVYSIIQFAQKVKLAIENNNLTRKEKINAILVDGVNLAESLGKQGKIISGGKLNFVIDRTTSIMKLTADEIIEAEKFVENSFVGFFDKPKEPTIAEKEIVGEILPETNAGGELLKVAEAINFEQPTEIIAVAADDKPNFVEIKKTVETPIETPTITQEAHDVPLFEQVGETHGEADTKAIKAE